MSVSPETYVAEFILARVGSDALSTCQIRVVRPYWQDNASCFLMDNTASQTLNLKVPDGSLVYSWQNYPPRMQFDASTGYLYMTRQVLASEGVGFTVPVMSFYTLDDTLGQISYQELIADKTMLGEYCPFLLSDGKITNLWGQESNSVEKFTITRRAPQDTTNWSVTDLVVVDLINSLPNTGVGYNFAYFDQSKFVHIVALAVTTDPSAPVNDQNIIIYSIPKTNFDALDTNNSLSWTSHSISGIDPAKQPITAISTIVIQSPSQPEPFLYCFYHALDEDLQLSFSYFSIRLQAGQEFGNVDPSALQATNISNPNWTSSSFGEILRTFSDGPPAVAQAGGGIFVFIGCIHADSGASGVVVMSQKIPESGILDPHGWFCDDTFLLMGAAGDHAAPSIASASISWAQYPNTTYDERVVLDITHQSGGNKD